MTKTAFMLIGSRQRLSTVTVSPKLAITDDFRVTQVATAKSLITNIALAIVAPSYGTNSRVM